MTFSKSDQETFFLSDGQLAPGSVTDNEIYNTGASLTFRSIEWEDKNLILQPSAGAALFGSLDGDSIGFSLNGGLGIRSIDGGPSGSLGLSYSSSDNGTETFGINGKITIPLH